MNILVTGGAGYIGLHTCVSLISQGYNLVIVDDFSNSEKSSILNLEKIVKRNIIYYELDIKNTVKLEEIFYKHKFDAVIHFAGYKSVNESINNPLKYYNNNIVCTTSLLGVCTKFGVKKIIFSSSASVYGENVAPIKEDCELLPTTNPYAESKVICERIFTDISKSDLEYEIIILRYFNPVGAHESGLIGDNPKGRPDNIMPYISRVAANKLEKLYVFGGDYNTEDGTTIRDFIHVMDLAEGHVAALNHLKKGIQFFNIGTGKGISILTLIEAFENVNDVEVPYEIIGRRAGDLEEIYADVTKTSSILKWNAKRTVEEMCKDSWNFEIQNKH